MIEPSRQQGTAHDASHDPLMHLSPAAHEAGSDRTGSDRTWRAADALRHSLWELTETEAAIPLAIDAARGFVRALHEHGASAQQIEAALAIAIADVFADLLVSQPGDEIAELDFAERAHQVVVSAFPAPRGD